MVSFFVVLKTISCILTDEKQNFEEYNCVVCDNIVFQKEVSLISMLEDKQLPEHLTEKEAKNVADKYLSNESIHMITTFFQALKTKYTKILSGKISMHQSFNALKMCETKVKFINLKEEILHFMHFLDNRLEILSFKIICRTHKNIENYKHLWQNSLYLIDRINTELKVINERILFNE